MSATERDFLVHALIGVGVLSVFLLRRSLRWFWHRLWTRPDERWDDEP